MADPAANSQSNSEVITGATTLPATAIVPTTATHATTTTTLGQGDTVKTSTAAVTAAVMVNGGHDDNSYVRRRDGQDPTHSFSV